MGPVVVSVYVVLSVIVLILVVALVFTTSRLYRLKYVASDDHVDNTPTNPKTAQNDTIVQGSNKNSRKIANYNHQADG